jgi:hypothetical protein
MRQPVARREHQPGQATGLFRLGEDAQTFGEELPFLAAVAAVAQRADALDQRIGEGVDAARQRT